MKSLIPQENAALQRQENIKSKKENLALEAMRLIARKDELEAELAKVKDDYKKIVENELPDIFDHNGDEVGSKTITPSGLSLTYDIKYRPHLKEKSRPAGHQWLKENGHEHAIKLDLQAHLDKGDFEKAELIKNYIKSLGVDIPDTIKESVHASTLASIIDKAIKAGDQSLDWDVFGIHTQRMVKINKPSK